MVNSVKPFYFKAHGKTNYSDMNLILIDIPEDRTRFFPLSLSRPISALRTGIFTIAEKWARSMKASVSHATADYLSIKFKVHIDRTNICINSRIMPDKNLLKAIKSLSQNEGLYHDNIFLAGKLDRSHVEKCLRSFDFSWIESLDYPHPVRQISHITDLYNNNHGEIITDMELVDARQGTITDQHTVCYNAAQIYIGKETNIRASVLDAEAGPIYIGDRVTLSPGTVVVGPAAILQGSVTSIGAKIRSNTTIGPYCKVGGEVNQVVLQGYSNKSHDGFLGSSVIGEWCNFGAGSNNSNLKNNYSVVKLWDYEAGKFLETGLQYCGLIMGDYSKCGINTMFNTGTVVGVCANIFGYGYMPKFIPSFSWGNNDGFVDYQLDKATETIQTVMSRRERPFTIEDSSILKHLFDFTAKYRGRI